MRIIVVFGISHKELQETTGTVNTVLVNPNQKDPHGIEFEVLDAIFSFMSILNSANISGVGLEFRKKGKKKKTLKNVLG